MEVLPKKRTTRKVCAEAANVFAVRIWNRCFGITHCLPSVVDLAAKGVVPTVRSSESAEVELEFVDVYRHPPFYKLPRRVQLPVLGLRPPLIIDAHGTSKIPIVESAQIGNSITRLSDCIAGASQHNGVVNSTVIQKIAQLSLACSCNLFSPDESRRGEMTGDFGQVSPGAQQFRAEFAHTSTKVLPSDN